MDSSDKSIALLEDDPSQADLICAFLKREGLACTPFATGAAFRSAVTRDSHDLLLVDWQLPDTSGIEILRWIRTTLGWELPVLFITSRNDKEDIALALETGADDYMVKPLFHPELRGRIHALLRRFHPAARQQAVRIGHIEYDPLQHRIRCHGEEIEMTPKEFALAEYILNHRDSLMGRDELLAHVWGIDTRLNTRTVDTHISRIRSKLGLTAENGWRLVPVYNHGYRLEAVTAGEED